MRKFLVLLFLLVLATNAFPANKWEDGSTTFFDGDATLINDLDTEIQDHILEPLNRYLINARAGMTLSYSSAAQVGVSAGTVVCSNAAGTLQELRRNTSSTTVTWADIDTGAEAASTTYYVYASCDADATTATFKISAHATTPTGLTSYRKIGSFYNDSSSNIKYTTSSDGTIDAYVAPSPVSEGTSYSSGVTYQNTTSHKLLIIAYSRCSGSTADVFAFIGETSSPTTQVAHDGQLDCNSDYYASITFVVPAGWYWQVTGTTLQKIEVWEI